MIEGAEGLCQGERVLRHHRQFQRPHGLIDDVIEPARFEHEAPEFVAVLALLAWGGWGMVIWAIFLRVTIGLHATWLINSATHIFGKRRFDIDDDSKNVWWVALLTFGEGWHNNHHAHPASARHGLRWFEFDITWQHIKLLRSLGWAKRVREARYTG